MTVRGVLPGVVDLAPDGPLPDTRSAAGHTLAPLTHLPSSRKVTFCIFNQNDN